MAILVTGGGIALLGELLRVGIGRFAFSSTAAVYGDPQQITFMSWTSRMRTSMHSIECARQATGRDIPVKIEPPRPRDP